MPDPNDLSGKVGLDTTTFKTGVSDLNAQIRSIETGFRASAAVMDNWSGNTQGLTARTDSLTQKLDLQKQKLSTLNDEYKKAVDGQGANSSAAQSLANQMFSAEKAIQSTENDLKKYNDQLKDVQTSSGKIDFSKLKSGLESVGSGAVSGIKAAGAAIAGMGIAVAGAAAGAAKLLSTSVANADELQRLSDVTGMSAETLQEFQYAGSALGVSLDTITGAQTKLIKNMQSASTGSKTQANAFKALGVSIYDLHGNLRDSQETMGEVFDALQKVENPTERDAIAMNLFGKSARDLNPLIDAGSDGLNQLTDEAQKNGAVMSDETVSGLDAFGDSLDASKMAAQGMAGTLASAALPALNNFTELLSGLTTSLNGALQTGDFSQFGTVLSDGISSMVTQLSGMITNSIPVISQVISGAIGAIAQAIPTALPALAAGVVVIITSILQILQDNGPSLITAGLQAIMTLISGLTSALPQIMSTAIEVILTLVNGISAQLPTLIPMAVQAILTIVDGLINNLPQIIDSAIEIILALVQGIMNALPQLLAEVPKIIMTIITGLVAALPQLIAAAPKIIVSIIMGIINALPQLITMMPQIIAAVITGLVGALPQLLVMGPQMLKEIWDGLASQDWGKIGSDIIKGIVDGFLQAWDYVKSAISNVGKKITDGFKSIFGIHSPSKLMRDEIGTNIGLGIAEGIQSVDFMGQIASSMMAGLGQVQNVANGISAVLGTPSTGALGPSLGSISQTNNFYGQGYSSRDSAKQYRALDRALGTVYGG